MAEKPDTRVSPVKSQQSVSDHLTGIITVTFPKRLRERAKSLLLYILMFGKSVIRVDISGKFRIHGKKMDSIITDYIYGILTGEDKKQLPSDFDYFKTVMYQINVPDHLLKGKSKRNSTLVSGSKSKLSKWLPY